MSEPTRWHIYITTDMEERPTADDIRRQGFLSEEACPAAAFAEHAVSRTTIGGGPWHVWWASSSDRIRCHMVHSTRAFFGTEVKP